MRKFLFITWMIVLVNLNGLTICFGGECSETELLVKLNTGAIENDSVLGTTPAFFIETSWFNNGVSYWEKIFPNPDADPKVGLNRWFHLFFDSQAECEYFMLRFKNEPLYEQLERNCLLYPQEVPNDPYFENQWHWQLLLAPDAWDMTHGSSDIVVAIIDSGTDMDHEDLADSIWINTDEPINGVDDDGNGYVDDRWGWDFKNEDNDPDNVNADNLHGTHVAGIVSAVTNNNIGVAGGTWGCSIMICKVFPDNGGGAYPSDVAQAIEYAKENGASVINMSLGGAPSSAMADAILSAYNAGVVVCASAGNGGADGIGDSDPSYPAAYPGVIAVGNTTRFDSKADSSNYGSWVDVFAPGTAIKSTLPNNNYKNESGTSMASPVTAALAALILSQEDRLTPDEVENRIEKGCENIDAFNPAFQGELPQGRINFLYSLADTPILGIDHIVVHDDNGNKNFEADNGETIDLDIYLIDHSWMDGYSIHATLTAPPGSGVTVLDGNADYGNIASHQIKKNTDAFTLNITTSSITNVEMTLNISATGYSCTETFLLSLNNPFPAYPGFPIERFGGFNASPKLADVNKDGSKEIITASNDGTIDVLTIDGSELPGWPQFVGSKQGFDSLLILAAPAIGDLDLDGYPEIVVADFRTDTEYINPNRPQQGTKYRYIGRIHVYHMNGVAMPGFPLEVSSEFVTSSEDIPDPPGFKCAPVIADVTDDEHPEIIVGNYGNKIIVVDQNGSIVSGWPRDLGTDIFATVATADFDLDGKDEIVVATKADREPYDYGDVYLFDGDGSVFPGFPVRTQNQIYSAPVLADMDGDSIPEIIFGFGDYDNSPDTPKGVRIIDKGGNDIDGWPVSTDGSVYGSPGIGDLDGDLSPEIVVGTLSGSIYAFHADGSPVPNWPVNAISDRIYSSPSIVDIDNTGGPEIIVGSETQELLLYHCNGQAVANSPISLDASGFASPAIDDLDNDGDLEIVMTAKSIYVFNLSTSYQAGKEYWKTFHGTNQNTGLYSDTIKETGVVLILNGSMFTGGDTFNLDCNITNAESELLENIDLFVLLDVDGYYWYYPSWSQTVDWLDIPRLESGTFITNIFNFTWPEGDFGSADGLKFWGAMLDSNGALLGNYDMISFGYQ